MKPAMKVNSNVQITTDMPSEEYHALKRLSSSGIKKLLVSAQDFWKSSWLNPDKDDTSSDAMNVGTAYHTRILDGKKAFDKAYAVKPECDRRTKEGKAVYAEFKEAYPDAQEIDAKLKSYIEAAAHRIESRAEFSRYFTDGNAEVSILWDDPETNVPMKARLDYMQDSAIIDLKTFSNSTSSDLTRIITGHIARYKYYVQAAVYREAARQATGKNMDMFFVFQQSGPINNTIPVHFGSDLLLAQKGEDEMRLGISKFADLYAKYGTEEWFDETEEIMLRDESFPLYVLD